MSILKYNQLVAQQRDLSATIHASLNTIVSALADKEKLATEQKQLQSEIPVSYPDLSVVHVRAKILDQVVRRLEGRDTTQLRDWTTRLATTGGNLED